MREGSEPKGLRVPNTSDEDVNQATGMSLTPITGGVKLKEKMSIPGSPTVLATGPINYTELNRLEARLETLTHANYARKEVAWRSDIYM